jgi:hypothetical protein
MGCSAIIMRNRTDGVGQEPHVFSATSKSYLDSALSSPKVEDCGRMLNTMAGTCSGVYEIDIETAAAPSAVVNGLKGFATSQPNSFALVGIGITFSDHVSVERGPALNAYKYTLSTIFT